MPVLEYRYHNRVFTLKKKFIQGYGGGELWMFVPSTPVSKTSRIFHGF